MFAKQFHNVKAGGHRVRGCFSFASGEILGWVIPRTSNGVSVDGRTEEGRGPIIISSLGPKYFNPALQLTDGSRGSWVIKCDPLSALVNNTADALKT